MESQERYQGILVSMGESYGFIKPNGGNRGPDIFVSVLEFDKAGLSHAGKGTLLEYSIGEKKGKKFAVDLVHVPKPRAMEKHDGAKVEASPSFTGVVKWFDPVKTYGFIRPDIGGKDVFVHITAVKLAGYGTLAKNARIEYQLKDAKGKTIAVELKLLV